MNDERCDRDRVTSILTLADEARAQGTWADVDWDPEWAYRRLLEALDIIDKAKKLHFRTDAHSWPTCEHCYRPWPCPTRQALSGGNESGDDR